MARRITCACRVVSLDGKLTSSKWAAIAKCSPDTALRDINDLLARGVLRKLEGGGRSAGYALNESCWQNQSRL